MKLKLIMLILLSVFFSNCGYKVVSQDYFKDYKIVEINTTGEKRVNFQLKNKLRGGNEDALKSIKIDLATEKIKTIKEKNIQNEITKYEITISVKVDFYFSDINRLGNFSIFKKGVFDVNERYSSTLDNEKKLIKNLTSDISEQIIKNLKEEINDT
tara:strand:+ start:3412 stop:3879 length:468 start_codon:yes stop_codon:yes gene_type:complete